MLQRPVASVIAILLVANSANAQKEVAQTPPNIVLIISDDHGWTDYGFMGSRNVRTPYLDRLASESLLFRRGTVPSSLCCPSLASLITGRYAHQHKITSNDPAKPNGMGAGEFAKSKAFLEGRERMIKHLEAVPTIPSLLTTKGYRSLQTGKWWQGDFRRGGFTSGMTKGQRHGDEGLEIGRKTMKPIAEFIDQSKSEKKPFFVWYAPMLPHQPHNPPERLLAKYRAKDVQTPIAKYRAMVEWFDETVGQLLGILDETGVAQNTIVVFLADNGWTQSADDAGSVRSKLTPYDAGLRTPIMIRWPGHVAPRASNKPVSSIDIAPTLLKAVGIPVDPGMSGINLLDDQKVNARDLVFGECFTHNAVALDRPSENLLWRWTTDGRWKLIVPKDRSAQVELYDTESDPGELKNLAGSQPDRVSQLRSQLDAWWTPEE